MRYARRLFSLFVLFILASSLVERAYASPVIYSGMFTADNSVLTIAFTSSSSQTYVFTTTSFASGGFVPVLTLFSAAGGNPLAFAETDAGDVSFSSLLGPGNYLLSLTEDPNVYETNYAAGPLFASSPTITGDTCGVSGGKFLDIFDNCSQRTGSYAVSLDSTAAPAVTPEPPSWLLVAPAVALLFVTQYRRRIA